MKRNMYQWAAALIKARGKKPLPLLSFPCIQLMDVTVDQMLSESRLQAAGMILMAERVDSAAVVSPMDLSVEAEAFGASVRFSPNEVPTVVGALICDKEGADQLTVPAVGAGRTGICLDAVREAARQIHSKPVLAGVIGPYSLAGRLLDVSEAMILCYEEPDLVHSVLRKATLFLIQYCRALREAGADGVILAEPLAGLLSPAMAGEFSHPYVRQIIDGVQQEDFCLIYHNCGSNVPLMAEDIFSMGAMGCHFGDAIDLLSVLPKAPADTLVLGNISPVARFRSGTPEEMEAAVQELLKRCSPYPNFLLSSGCDIPPQSSWDNIDAFFRAAAMVNI